MRIGVVVGNPKPASRTLAAASALAQALGDGPPAVVVDVVTLGAGLLGFGDPAVATAIESVQGLEALVVASPTYKGAATGVLKCFLDQFPSNGLAGVVAIPMMLGAGPHHALAPEYALRPILVELGATCPTRGCYLLDAAIGDPGALEPFLELARPQLAGLLGA